MPLFLPSNLSPNFQEVITNVETATASDVNIDFEFQVNSSGACVRSYKLEILNGRNDADDPDDNILATFYGIFPQELYNKDIYTISITHNQLEEKGVVLRVPNDYRWRIRLYEDRLWDIEEDGMGNQVKKNHIQTVYGNTYVGAGNVVGTTRNTIWFNGVPKNTVEDKYIETILYSYDTNNDFNPFNIKNLSNNDDYVALIQYEDYKQQGICYPHFKEYGDELDGFKIDLNDILPEYRKKISDGNMYISVNINYESLSPVPNYDTNRLPKLIIGLECIDDAVSTTDCLIKIDEQQGFIDYERSSLNIMQNTNPYLYSLVYIQREQIYSVDKSIGTHQLTKITLDEPLDYNTFHNSKIRSNLVSDNFDYDRVYIDPVAEFDSKLIPSAYINIAYTADQLIQTSGIDITTSTLKEQQENNKSLACITLDNYVSKTGECALHSDLKFMPDRYYMYQIFIVDREHPDYGPEKAVNPYKFYAGTIYDGSDLDLDTIYYLGGGCGSESKDLLSIYSNHQIGNTNQFLCFIQPNLGIFEDLYKPCTLQLYNNKYQKDVYITNYNGGDESTYNKDISIDHLDESQWLVVLTLPDAIDEDKNVLNSLVEKPQTQYKIYTNFVNSIPEAYFYYRSDKSLTFQYYDFYDVDLENPLATNIIDSNIMIPARDVIIKCNIHDSDSMEQNLVPIKYYSYAIGEVDADDKSIKTIIAESGLLYDGKYQYIIQGLSNYYESRGNSSELIKKENPTLYRIQITAVDDYGQIHEYSQDVYFGYIEEIVNDRISASLDHNTQSAHISFSPIKTFEAKGNFVDRTNEYITISDEGLSFSNLDNGSDISLKQGAPFDFIAKIRPGKEMFESEAEHDLLEIITDADDEGKTIKYRITFDTRIIINKSDKFVLNSEYLYFKLYRNDEKIGEEKSQINTYCIDHGDDWELIIPKNFKYAFDKTSNPTSIYMLESNLDELSVDNEKFNIDQELIGDNSYYLVPGRNTEYYIYDQNERDINQYNADKIPLLLCNIKELGGSATLIIRSE